MCCFPKYTHTHAHVHRGTCASNHRYTTHKAKKESNIKRVSTKDWCRSALCRLRPSASTDTSGHTPLCDVMTLTDWKMKVGIWGSLCNVPYGCDVLSPDSRDLVLCPCPHVSCHSLPFTARHGFQTG